MICNVLILITMVINYFYLITVALISYKRIKMNYIILSAYLKMYNSSGIYISLNLD